MGEVRKTVGRRVFLTRLAALVMPAAALLSAGNTAQAKKQTVLGKSAWSGTSPKKSSKVRHAVHTAHAFGRSSR